MEKVQISLLTETPFQVSISMVNLKVAESTNGRTEVSTKANSRKE